MTPLTLVRTSYRFAGHGYIAGELPDGIVTVNSVPSSRQVELRDRESRAVVLVVFSAADGTFRFDNVDPLGLFDVIGRDWSGTYNDVIVSRITPMPY